MTLNVKPCYGCPLRHPERFNKRKRCEILQSKLNGVRGLNLKSIDFDCPTKTALFHVGQIVTFKGRNPSNDDGYGNGGCLESFRGVVIGWRGRHVRIVSEETDKPFCSILPSRLTPTGEEKRCCIHCRMPEGFSIKVKMPTDQEPRQWECRRAEWDKIEEREPVLPCEYSGNSVTEVRG